MSRSAFPTISKTLESIEQRLGELIPSERDLLAAAMRYALLGEGKRLRPLLVLASSSAFGVPLALALNPACAIEMIHAYSLVHDDLPCMDDDDMRRGRPSLHRAFPEAIALLAGDALLTQAFSVLATAEGIDHPTRVRLIATMASRIGREGMAGGQAADILSPASQEIYQKKTGELFSCCLEFGAILASKSVELQEEVRQIGLHLGLAYQIRDDLEDLSTPHPSRNKQKTLTTLLGIDPAKKLLEESVQTAQKEMQRIGFLLPNEILSRLI